MYTIFILFITELMFCTYCTFFFLLLCRFIPGGNAVFIYSSSGQARGRSCMWLTNSPAPSLVHGSSERMTLETSNFQSDVNKAGLCDTCFTGRDKDGTVGDEGCRHSRPGLFLASCSAVSCLPGAAAAGFRRPRMLSAFIPTYFTCRHNISPAVPHARCPPHTSADGKPRYSTHKQPTQGQLPQVTLTRSDLPYEPRSPLPSPLALFPLWRAPSPLYERIS